MRIKAAMLARIPSPRIAITDILVRLGICKVRTMKKGVMAQDQSMATWAAVPQ